VDYLKASGTVVPGKFVAHAESAGGLVVAAALNEIPSEFAGVVNEVPFVDLMNSLIDEALPTTLADRDEFGDPTDSDSLATLLRLSPVDGVRRAAYPPVLATVGLHDPRVPAREGLRWVRALRRRNTGSAQQWLFADTESGHGGPTGRAREVAHLSMLQAFMLDCLVITKTDDPDRPIEI